ncbi:MAG: BrnT family toxin [Candidatus Atribacteria bacterium]|nr:MAG: BrnT family toxin [Candidatus Atribacteria bacterium]
MSDDTKHSKIEKRFYALGKSKTERFLFISFTIRNNLIRVISARDMNRKERMIYEEKIEENTKI